MKLTHVRQTLCKDFEKAWKLNDKAHRIEHFQDVEETGHIINRRACNGAHDDKLILLAAYFHDMFAWSRFNHHLLSATWVRTTDYPLVEVLSDKNRELLAQGCEYHRASGTAIFPSEFAELICSADRGRPGNVDGMVMRAFQYRKSHFPKMGRKEALKSSVAHVKEKYGTDGYARYPNLYLKAMGNELAEQRLKIDALKPETYVLPQQFNPPEESRYGEDTD